MSGTGEQEGATATGAGCSRAGAVLGKLIGGLMTVMGWGSGLLILVQDTNPGGEAPPPQWMAIPGMAIGAVGLLLFLVGDRRLKQLDGLRVRRTLRDELRLALVLLAAIALLLLFFRD